MKNIIAFAGSNSRKSINKQLVALAGREVTTANTTVLDLNDFELPLYGVDYEVANGIPDNATRFLSLIKASDGIILSLAEHNGAYAAVFKNIFDWMSRIDSKLWNDKPMLLMATSPGGRGGQGVLGVAKSAFPHLGGNIVADFSLPSFNQNFSEEGIGDLDLKKKFNEAISIFEKAI